MGDFTANGGMWPEQASADELRSADIGAPVSSAGESLFMPLLVSPTPVGNSEADSQVRAVKSPAQFCIRHLGPAGIVVTRTPFRPGASIKYYLAACNLIGKRMRYALVVNKKRVRMSYVPALGESLSMTPPAHPFVNLGEK